jgi:hypothetical protein
MSRKSFIIAASLLTLGLASFASAKDAPQRFIYVGGHEPARAFRAEAVPTAPYALTGSQTTPATRFEPIWVGSRIVGYRAVPR